MKGMTNKSQNKIQKYHIVRAFYKILQIITPPLSALRDRELNLSHMSQLGDVRKKNCVISNHGELKQSGEWHRVVDRSLLNDIENIDENSSVSSDEINSVEVHKFRHA